MVEISTANHPLVHACYAALLLLTLADGCLGPPLMGCASFAALSTSAKTRGAST